eukprot:4612551-Amphidinium_carterae.1
MGRPLRVRNRCLIVNKLCDAHRRSNVFWEFRLHNFDNCNADKKKPNKTTKVLSIETEQAYHKKGKSIRKQSRAFNHLYTFF